MASHQSTWGLGNKFWRKEDHSEGGAKDDIISFQDIFWFLSHLCARRDFKKSSRVQNWESNELSRDFRGQGFKEYKNWKSGVTQSGEGMLRTVQACSWDLRNVLFLSKDHIPDVATNWLRLFLQHLNLVLRWEQSDLHLLILPLEEAVTFVELPYHFIYNVKNKMISI